MIAGLPQRIEAHLRQCAPHVLEREGHKLLGEALEALKKAPGVCLERVGRPAGHGGRWEGYGEFKGEKTGAECARDILLMYAGGTPA